MAPTLPSSPPSAFLAPYRRITSTGAFIPEIDGLRFLAIFSVFIYHLAGDVLRHSSGQAASALKGNWLFDTTQILNFGVPMFFVISGFILGAPFAAAHLRGGRPVELKKYFWRRVTRLEPPYVLCLLIFFALKILGGRGTAHDLFPNLLASIFYVHNIVFASPSVINFVAWSLEIEIQFYILAPLLALMFAISSPPLRRSVLIALLLLATAISGLVSTNQVLGHTLLGYAQYFLAGFLLVDFYLSGGDRRRGKSLWDWVSAAGWIVLLALLVRGGTLANWTVPWLLIVLYIAAFHGVYANRFVTNPWIATIGGMCYTIYLLHNYLISSLGLVTERLLAAESFWTRLGLQFLIMSPIVLVVCALFFRWVERPCMRPDWIRRAGAALRAPRDRWLLASAANAVSRSGSEE
jgi:peptidoglycan/LPS O-acetylase OafA/YrhL